MSFGSPRTGPNLRLKRGLKKRLSIGQQSWTKGRRKASKLSNNCHARGRTNDTQNALGTTSTSSPTKLWRRPKPAPSVGALRSFLRSIAHDLHAAARIVASFDPASVREPNEGRCGGNECAFVEDRVDLASAAPFAVDYGDRLVVNHWRFRHRMTPERINDRTAGSSVSRE
jgi:hypothetical protein